MSFVRRWLSPKPSVAKTESGNGGDLDLSALAGVREVVARWEANYMDACQRDTSYRTFSKPDRAEWECLTREAADVIGAILSVLQD